MATNYVQPGKVLTLLAPYDRTSGQGALVGNIFGISTKTVLSGVASEFAVTGVWSLAKTSAQAWTQGQKIYWDNTNKRADGTATAGFRFIGFATDIAANPSSTGTVKLTGGGAALYQSDNIAAPSSHADAGPVTLTPAEIMGGTIVIDTSGAGRTYTFPTAALLVAAAPGVAVGDKFDVLMVNGADAAEVITLAAGSGGAFDANQTASSRVIGQNTSKLVRVRITVTTPASEAYVMYA